METVNGEIINDHQAVLSKSPKPETESSILELSFPDAIREILIGKKVTRREWGNEDEYGLFYNNFLTIHTKGNFHSWLVNSGDLEAIDWYVCGEVGK